MKKLISVLFLVAVFALCGSVSAFAVPVIDGSIAPGGEWANLNSSFLPLSYYLEINSPPAGNDWISTMVMSHVVLLQELTSNDSTVTTAQQGMYLLIEVYGPGGPQLNYPDSALYPAIPGMTHSTYPPSIQMTGDFLGDGLSDNFNLFVRTLNLNPTAPVDDHADSTFYCVGSEAHCNALNPSVWSLLTTVDRAGVLEYFFPSSLLPGGIGYTPFPTSFVGKITYDNGVSSTGGTGTGDQVVTGTLVPEPASMFLMITGLVGLFAKKRFLA